VKVTRLDSIPLDGSFLMPEGVFVDSPIVTRTGIFEYTNPDGSKRRELRLAKHVFDKESLASYKHKPVIITHDVGRVTKDNIAENTVGLMTSDGFRDGDNVRVEVGIHDVGRIKEFGYRGLSLGYDLTMDETPGVYKGQPYDAIQLNIRVNHLALVRDARAGESARLNLDSQNKKGATTNMSTVKIMSADTLERAFASCKQQGLTNLDDVRLVVMKAATNLDASDGSGADPVKKSDTAKKSDAEAVLSPEDKVKHIREKFDSSKCDVSDVGTLLECIEILMARNDATAAAKDAAKGEEDPDDEKKEMNADSVDALVTERIQIIRIGDKLNLDGLEGMKPIDAKKSIVKAVLPKMNLDGRSAVYIQAAFDQAVENINARKDVGFQRYQMTQRVDGVPAHMQTGKTAAEDSRARMINRMNGGEE